MNATGGEIGDFELDVNGSLGLAQLSCATHAATKSSRHASPVLVISFDRGQAQLCPHEELLPPAELLDLPNDGRLLRCVVDGANISAEAGRVRVFWDRDQDFHIVSGATAFKLRFGLLTR